MLGTDQSIFRKMPAPAQGIRAFTPVFAGYGWIPVFRPKMRQRKNARAVFVFGPYETALAGEDLDFAVDAGDDLELALVALVVVAGDHPVVAFRQDHARERANRFLDHVAGGAQH
jgi:hypothetical protein